MGDSSTREIFLKIMNFEPSDRTIKWEFGYWEATLERWHREGLPKLGSGDDIIGPGHAEPNKCRLHAAKRFGDGIQGPFHPLLQHSKPGPRHRAALS